jgi:hypothetical protein
MVLFQETKLSNIIPSKLSSFMPRTLNDNRSLPATGSSGGLLTAWNNSFFSCTHHNSSLSTLSVYLTETSSNLYVCITNVYAASTPELRPAFLEELKEIAPTDGVPWLICGDFNMIRFGHEKNDDNFKAREADAFNDTINDLSLIELPLIDRRFTWSNQRANPTLERIDRAFINLAWDAVLPNSILSSLTRTTSDHVPLKIQISSYVPKSAIYRYEPSWALQPGFHEMVGTAWNLHRSPSDPAASLVIRLKRTRAGSKDWHR